MKRKAMSVVKKKTIASFQQKENKEISKDACNKNFLKINPKGSNHIENHYIKISLEQLYNKFLVRIVHFSLLWKGTWQDEISWKPIVILPKPSPMNFAKIKHFATQPAW